MEFDPILICPVCKELSSDPYECISCHQTYCKDCTVGLNNLCKNCKRAIGFEYSRVARKIIADIDVACKFCQTIVKKGDMESHYSNCNKFILTCRHSSCNFTGSKNAFIEHIIVTHKSEVLDFFCRDHSKDLLKISNFGKLYWQNGSKDYVKDKNGKFLYSTENPIQGINKIIVNFSNCKDYSYCMIGFSQTKYNGSEQYLGGETGPGTWGLAGNGVIGEEGKWNKSFQSLLKYTTEDIILSFNKGKIEVTVGNRKNTYMYHLNAKSVYLTVGLYHSGGKVTITYDSVLGAAN